MGFSAHITAAVKPPLRYSARLLTTYQMTKAIGTIAIIGLGKAGKSLYFSCLANKVTTQGFHHQAIPKDLSVFDALFLAVPDSSIEQTAQQLSTHKLPNLVAHLCGARDLNALQALESRTQRAQFHPLAVLSGLEPIAPQSFVGICAENEASCLLLQTFAQQIGLKPFLIKQGSQSLYHAAAVILSNHAFVLAHDALQLFQQAGIQEDIARQALASLLHSTAHALANNPLLDAITGPLKRGDLMIVQKHIDTLKNYPDNTSIVERYMTMSKALSSILNLGHHHSP